MVNDFNQLFYQNSYQTEFTAHVVEQKESKGKIWLSLSKTCFYPEGGGQPGDQGILFLVNPPDAEISQVMVQDTVLSENEIWHQVDRLLPPGSEVRGEVDFELRYDLMQQHSAEHIVSGIVNRKYNYDNVGFNISYSEMTFDFNGDLTWQQIIEIEDEANQAIFKNIPIEIHYLSPEEQQTWKYRSKLKLDENVRVVLIPGYDICACAGTHLKRTGEIGQIKIIKRESYKGGVRLTALCGMRALKYFQHLHNVIRGAGEILSANSENLIDAVNRQQAEQAELKLEINQKNNAWLELYKKNIPCKTSRIIIENKLFSKQEWRYVCRYLIDAVTDFVCLLTENGQNNYLLFLYSETSDLREYIPLLKNKLAFKGGGNSNSIQGSLQGKIQNIKEVLHDMT